MIANKQLKILCLFGCLLGNKTVSITIKDILVKFSNVHTTYINVTSADYTRYPAPKWKKFLGMTMESLHIINRKIELMDFTHYDLVIVQGFEYGWAVNSKVKNIPCIMFTDSTPTVTQRMNRQYLYNNFAHKLRALFLEKVYQSIFRNIFNNIDYIFPQTEWCRRSMIIDYGIAKEKVSGCAIAADLNIWKTKQSYARLGKPRLLFVGNDFKRKGGLFLLSVFSKISNKVDLTIVSNDGFFKIVAVDKNIEYWKDVKRSKLPDIFQKADIFIFPTFKEHFGMVQIEALASGLPLISRDVGGVSDAVIDGYNGYLMPYNSTEDDWIEKIEYLISHPEERERMGKNSRKLAETKFSLDKFKEKIVTKINQLASKFNKDFNEK